MPFDWIRGVSNFPVTKQMRDRIFIDTNILINCYSEEKEKKEISLSIINEYETKDIVISLQVINEFINVLKKKFSKKHGDIRKALDEMESSLIIWDLSIDLIRDAIRICERYQYSYYDSLIISSAIDSGCKILYSEDMQHNQLIDGKLRILNPFIK